MHWLVKSKHLGELDKKLQRTTGLVSCIGLCTLWVWAFFMIGHIEQQSWLVAYTLALSLVVIRESSRHG